MSEGVLSDWGDCVCIPVTIPKKPRHSGLTMVIDKGLGPTSFSDLMAMGRDAIDFIKLGFGTSLLYPPGILERKISLAKQHGVQLYPGGTLLEIAELQGTTEQFFDQVCVLGIDLVEVSEGTIPLLPKRRTEIIRSAAQRGLHILSEVGKKSKGSTFDPVHVHRQVEADLEAGAEHIIVEGRDSGKGVGVYDDDGAMNEKLVDAIIAGVADPEVLIWEAPLVSQQQKLILKLGPSVNLGNVQPEDTITLAATRAGLRGDTFRLVVEKQLGPAAGA
jgi:phosphosulfolactate synthase